jgi:2-isopropylmalate synthase
VVVELERIGVEVERDDPRVVRLLEVVKEREAVGYAHEAADASFELLARRMLGKVPQYFDVT